MSAATAKIAFGLDELNLYGLTFSQTILHKFPGLKEVAIRALEVAPSGSFFTETLLEFFTTSRWLQAIQVEEAPIPLAIAELLASFEHLKRLKITVNSAISSTHTSAFLALEYLHITSNTLRAISSFVGILASPLVTLTILIIDGSVALQELSHTLK